jgi:hypothetical protein
MARELTFVCTLRLLKPSLAKTSLKEQAIIDQHFEYLKGAVAEGRLFFAGRCLNDKSASSSTANTLKGQAEDFMKNDLAIKKCVVKGLIYIPFVSRLKRGPN